MYNNKYERIEHDLWHATSIINNLVADGLLEEGEVSHAVNAIRQLGNATREKLSKSDPETFREEYWHTASEGK